MTVHVGEHHESIEIPLQARTRVFLGIESPTGALDVDPRWLSRIRILGPDGEQIPLAGFGNVSRGPTSPRGYVAFHGMGRCQVIGGWVDGVGWLAPAEIFAEPGSDQELVLAGD